MPDRNNSFRSRGAPCLGSSSKKAKESGLRSVSRRSSEVALFSIPSHHTAGVKRWDGNRRTTTDWDGLRRDSDLWFPDGDCLVHLHAEGRSRRGPSFRLPMAQIACSNDVIMNCGSQSGADSPCSTDLSSSSDGGYFQDRSNLQTHELYIPAPTEMSPDEAFRYHLTTRNVFAGISGKPIVGFHLSQALIDLLERMNTFSSTEEDDLGEILDYMDEQGYLDFRESPDYALAVLNFAEHFEIPGLWTNAFAHCAGMNNRLVGSGEFEFTSYRTKASIVRARLDIDLRLEHAARSLSNFLEDDLSAAYLGLGSCARTHLDRFRSFLQSFYVGRYGYWPPAIHGTNNLGSSHAIFRSMYLEFRNLYECLVDTESGISIRDQRLADGGLCVFQNVTDFATRHSYVPLPHPLPLLPESVAGSAKSRSAATLDVRKIRMPFGGRQAKQERRNAAIMALSAATNHENPTVKNCPLVREYMRFEHTCASKEDEKIPLAEARKVRWILIYSIFQVLVSVNRAPDEVRDTGGVSYPLCVRMIGEPPWKTRTKAEKSEWKANRIDIKPDADPLKMGPNSYKESSKKRQARSNPLSNLLDRGQARDLKPEEVDSDSGSSSSPASGWSIKSASSSNDCLTNMDHVSVHSSTKEHESKKMSESSAKDRGGPNVSQRVS